MSDTLEDCVTSCLKNNKYIESNLRDLISEIEEHHVKCNVARTVGTTIGVAGTATLVGSIFLAPFTGGASLAVGLTSLGCTLAGGGTQLVTDLVDNKKTKKNMENLEGIVSAKNRKDLDLKKQLENLNKMVHQLVTEKGVDEERALIGVLTGIAQGNVILDNEESMFHFLRAYHVTIPTSIVLMQNMIFRSTLQLASSELRLLSYFGIGTMMGKTFLETTGRIVAVGAIVFSVVDVGLLINSWAKEHPSLEAVQKLKSDIMTEVHNMEKLSELLEKLKEKVVCDTIRVQDKMLSITGVEQATDLLWTIFEDQMKVQEYFKTKVKLKIDVKLLKYEEILVDALKSHLDGTKEKEMVKEIIKLRGTKAKAQIKTTIANLVKQMEEIKNEQSEEKDKKRSKRGEHVINNDVLKFQVNVIDSFCHEVFGKSFAQTRVYREKLETYKQYEQPVSKKNTENIKSNLIAHIDNDVIYIDANQVLYGILILLLKLSCVKHMKELYYDYVPAPSGTQYTTHLKTTTEIMNSAPFFVDPVALGFWLRQNGSRRDVYESASNEVKYLFYNLYGNLRKWVIEFREYES